MNVSELRQAWEQGREEHPELWALSEEVKAFASQSPIAAATSATHHLAASFGTSAAWAAHHDLWVAFFAQWCVRRGVQTQ